MAPRSKPNTALPLAHRRSVEELERAIADEFVRRRADGLRRFVQSDAALERVRAIALKKALRHLTSLPSELRPEHERAIMREVERQLSHMTEETLRKLADDVEHAAQQGGLAAAHGRRLISSGLGADATHGTTDIIEAQRIPRAFLNPRMRRLSSTLWRQNRQTRTAMREAIGDALRGGRSVTLAADRLLVASDPVVRLPRYMREIEAAARGGNTRVLRRTVRKHIGTVRALGEGADRERGSFTLRQHVEQFINDAQGATHEDVDRAMRYYLQSRARYQARMVARTEMSAALNDAYAEAIEHEPFAAGLKWNVSPTHPRPDICDQYAGADPHGLGKGVYPNSDAKPEIPAHPHCQCFWTTSIDRNFARRRLEAARRARANGTSVQEEEQRARVVELAPGPRKSFHDWLREQSPGRRRAILGHGRTRRFDKARTARERDRIVNPRTGRFAPLWQIDRRAQPGRRLGPAIRVIPDPRHDPGRAAQAIGREVAAAPRRTPIASPPLQPTPRPAAAETLRRINGYKGDASLADQRALRGLFGDDVDAATLNRMGALPEGFRFRELDVRLHADRSGFGYGMRSEIETNDGQHVGTLHRSFKRTVGGPLIAKHDLFVINEEHQQHGLGRQVLREQFRAYERLGVSQIRVQTAWEGRYVWGNLGFAWSPETARAVRPHLERWLVNRGFDRMQAATLAEYARDPFDLAKMVDAEGNKIGKEYMLRAIPGWDGYIDFTPGSPTRTRYAERLGIHGQTETTEAPTVRSNRRRPPGSRR